MKKGLLKKVLSVLLVGVISSGLVACGGKTESDSNDMLDAIKEKGELVVGMSADYAPYEFHMMKDGKDEIVGFDVEIAKEIAKDMGVDLKIQEMEFDALVTALPAEKVDLVISGMNPTEERKKAVDFSDIYYVSTHGVLVKAEDKDKYKSIEDLNRKKIGVQLGSVQEKIAKEKVQDAQLTQLSNINNLIMELKTGKVDALIIETPVAEMGMKANDDLALSEIKLEEESGGNAIGIKKGSPKLVEAVNKTLNGLIDSGKLDQFIIDATVLAGEAAEQQ